MSFSNNSVLLYHKHPDQLSPSRSPQLVPVSSRTHLGKTLDGLNNKLTAGGRRLDVGLSTSRLPVHPLHCVRKCASSLRAFSRFHSSDFSSQQHGPSNRRRIALDSRKRTPETATSLDARAQYPPAAAWRLLSLLPPRPCSAATTELHHHSQPLPRPAAACTPDPAAVCTCYPPAPEQVGPGPYPSRKPELRLNTIQPRPLRVDHHPGSANG
ncbi:hypothetical protein TOPH_03045 [Tolypocladium ophioglossoides CBS 100239]|uniref:Uncharacterized protein n=1 Tax=Tolypocladium ophioglossoides (strain CBS 100239) TaxID=1163406 RepID=A0A0L0NF28_TOLOC|nr:hypothetical protein TOPH_03045 [Tolypocladium ophioglossoides CBS 100239]